MRPQQEHVVQIHGVGPATSSEESSSCVWSGIPESFPSACVNTSDMEWLSCLMRYCRSTSALTICEEKQNYRTSQARELSPLSSLNPTLEAPALSVRSIISVRRMGFTILIIRGRILDKTPQRKIFLMGCSVGSLNLVAHLSLRS